MYKKDLIIIPVLLLLYLSTALFNSITFWCHVYITDVHKETWKVKRILSSEEAKEKGFTFSKNPYEEKTITVIYETDGFLMYKDAEENISISHFYEK